MTSPITNIHYFKNIAQQCTVYKIMPENNTGQTFYHTVKDVAIESAAATLVVSGHSPRSRP
jgi:hypothetical protein